ncbi:MAG: FKBP-type peptidyl-prolyl cis-trans isomerase [Actinomycetales bacterium]
MRRILAILVPALLLLSGCSGAGTPAASSSPSASVPDAHAADLASVKVTAGDAGKAPKVDFTKPLKISAESIKVVSEGNGAKVTNGQSVVLRSVGYNADTGASLGDDYSSPTGQSFILNDSFKSQYPLVYSTFVGAKVGSQVAYGIPGTPATAGSTSSAGPSASASPSTPAQPAQLVIYQIESAKDAPKLLSKDETDKLDKAGDLPTVAFDAKGVPSITIPKKDAPTDLVAKVLTEGTGATLKSSDTITANYTGWQWSDGSKFDSSYDKGAPVDFPLSSVIPGWTQGLTGQKVGSKVLLVIPAVLAYGDTATAGQPSGPLVFVIDIQAKK